MSPFIWLTFNTISNNFWGSFHFLLSAHYQGDTVSCSRCSRQLEFIPVVWLISFIIFYYTVKTSLLREVLPNFFLYKLIFAYRIIYLEGRQVFLYFCSFYQRCSRVCGIMVPFHSTNPDRTSVIFNFILHVAHPVIIFNSSCVIWHEGQYLVLGLFLEKLWRGILKIYQVYVSSVNDVIQQFCYYFFRHIHRQLLILLHVSCQVLSVFLFSCG